MKRDIIVEKLIAEGISEKTLVRLTDKQLNELADRMLGEDLTTTAAAMQKSPQIQQIAKTPGQNIKLVGEEDMTEDLKGNQNKIDKNKNGKIDAQDFKMMKAKKCEHCDKELSKCTCDDSHLEEAKPSAGLSKEKKSEVVKKAKAGEDIGKKGKGFEKIATKAAKKYGSKEAGQKVAAAAMWKNIHESDSSLNAKRNLHFELKEAGVSDVDLETKDINELAKKYSKNPHVKNAHEFYKRISDKTMSMTGKDTEVKEWVMNLAENELYHSFTSKNEIMGLIQTKLNESKHIVENEYLNTNDIKKVITNQLKKNK